MVVPADAFYEWKVIDGGKQPYAIARQDGEPMAFAGLWEPNRMAICLDPRRRNYSCPFRLRWRKS